MKPRLHVKTFKKYSHLQPEKTWQQLLEESWKILSFFNLDMFSWQRTPPRAVLCRENNTSNSWDQQNSQITLLIETALNPQHYMPKNQRSSTVPYQNIESAYTNTKSAAGPPKSVIHIRSNWVFCMQSSRVGWWKTVAVLSIWVTLRNFYL